MNVIQRLLELLNEKNLKMSDLCAYIDINASTLTTWKTRNTDPPAKYIIRVCEFLNVSPEYLLTGEETKKTPSPSLKDDESEILDVYRQLDRRGQARMLTAGYDELDRLKGGQAATTAVSQNAG